MSDVEAVLFDLDDTLCEYRRTGAELLAIAYDRLGVDPFFGVEHYYGRYEEFVDESDGVEDLRERCFAAIARDRGRDTEVGRELARAYAAERDHRNVRPLRGAREAVRTLSETHRLGMVTNGSPEMQRQKLDGLGIRDAFETVVYAGYDAPAKPAPDPFERALSVLDVPPERAVHVGNSPASDVEGAQAAGLRAALVPASGSVERETTADYVLDSAADLVSPPWQ